MLRFWDGAEVHAAAIKPDLQEALDPAAADGPVPVIMRLVDTIGNLINVVANDEDPD
jgi:hypothetical protein